MTVTGRQLIDFVNARGDNEIGVCVCSHWADEHHDGTCDPCLDNAAGRDDPHAATDHAFVYSDEATAASDYLNQRALELGFRFEAADLPEGRAASETDGGELEAATESSDAWFIDQAIQAFQDEGSIEIDTAEPVVSRGEEGAYVKAWVFVERPTSWDFPSQQ